MSPVRVNYARRGFVLGCGALLAAGGLYARLWAHQSGGFLGDEADDEEVAAAVPAVTPVEDDAEAPRLREPAHAGHDRPAGTEPIA